MQPWQRRWSLCPKGASGSSRALQTSNQTPWAPLAWLSAGQLGLTAKPPCVPDLSAGSQSPQRRPVPHFKPVVMLKNHSCSGKGGWLTKGWRRREARAWISDRRARSRQAGAGPHTWGWTVQAERHAVRGPHQLTLGRKQKAGAGGRLQGAPFHPPFTAGRTAGGVSAPGLTSGRTVQGRGWVDRLQNKRLRNPPAPHARPRLCLSGFTAAHTSPRGIRPSARRGGPGVGRGEAVCLFTRALTVELEIRDGGERGAAAEDWSLAVALGREDVGAQVPAVVLGAGGDRQGRGRGSAPGPEDGGGSAAWPRGPFFKKVDIKHLQGT